MGCHGLALLLSATAWAAALPGAGGLPRRPAARGTAVGLERRAAEGEEDTLKRPVKVFTIFDRRFTRIAKVWRSCMTKAIPRPLAAMSVEAREVTRKGLLLLQTGLPSAPLSQLLMQEWAKKLAVSDTLHIDADAFLLQDPVRSTVIRYPQADIIAVVDCVHDKSECPWYRSHEFLGRHHGEDPLEAQGFMLNTGFMYLRSTPATMHLLNRTIALTREGENEQVALNEALLDLGCTWTLPSGSPAPRGRAALDALQHGALNGTCSPGVGPLLRRQPKLRVVVLPYSAVPRSDDPRHRRGRLTSAALAFHPGGRIEDKERLLGYVRRLCLNARP
mmetsp:Transcript_24438/g.70112  ORF Transcript_24438/g.70112 Transcript_24438/m.70112 type:complete len:333 (-) Transcript_24438:130-1128(-)